MTVVNSKELSAQPLRVAAVVLAAGKGSRFGSDKRLFNLKSLLPLPSGPVEGIPMAVQSIAQFSGLGLGVIVVIPPDDLLPQYYNQFAARWPEATPAPHQISWVECKDHAAGMGHSLASGVRAAQLAGFEACLIALADMPFVQLSTLETLAGLLTRGESLVRPSFKGVAGHPVGFGQEWFPKLIGSTGNEGAKSWLGQFKHKMQIIPVNDPGVLKDVDQLSDVE